MIDSHKTNLNTPLRIGVVVALVAFVIGAVWLISHRKTQLELSRDQLVLKEGRLLLKDTTIPFTGVMVENYQQGMLCSKSSVSNGVLDGLSEGWYTNGQKQVEEQFVKGVSHGARIKWYENGVKQSECSIVKGEIEGTFKRWDSNNVLSEIISMKNGKPDGLSMAFYPSGCVKAEARMASGQVVTQKFWKDGERKADQAAVGLVSSQTAQR